MLARFLRRIVHLARFRQHARDLEEELALHRALAGRRSMGNETLAREDARTIWIGRGLDEAAQDARFAVRTMVRQPVFALCAIAIVALGVGGATCVFGLLDTLVIRSLPVERPERLVWLRSPAFSNPI
jgi:hypothetical protein